MKGYIDRKAAEQAKPEFLNEKVEGYEKAIYAKGWNDCNTQYRENILSILAADVAEVRHGKWVWDGFVYDAPWQCSECGAFSEYESNYCPNCGAKMDRESIEEEN